MLSASVALVITLVLGPVVIPLLRWLKFGQHVRSDGPSRHIQKAGTPTMGGIMFLLAVAITSGLMYSLLPGRDIVIPGIKEGLIVLLVFLGYGFIGFLDDFIKISLKRPLGLRAREKILGQVLIAVGVAVMAVFILGRGTDIVIPFTGFFQPGGITIDLGWWFFLALTIFVMLGTANAVNLTDGLDGLAAGLTVIAAAVFAVIALIMDKGWVALILGAVAGGCLGFLYYNRFPAKVFMGDTGSLALGGVLAAAAVISRSELFLLIIGGVFVVETVSVILQVISYQLWRRRIFRMSPLHHHFELLGWSEVKVVTAFWAAGILLAVIGMAGLYRLG